MAKSDSFFIRAVVDSNGTTYAQHEIDLGSFVNLGVKSSTLLRIHNVQVGIRDESYPGSISVDDAQALIGWQLTTQNQTAPSASRGGAALGLGRGPRGGAVMHR